SPWRQLWGIAEVHHLHVMRRSAVESCLEDLERWDGYEEFVLMGHDGPGHLAISARKPVLRGLGLYHGKRGSGVSVEFDVQHGPVTILGVTQTAEGSLKMIAAEGESIAGPTLRIGNTNSRLRFGRGTREFVNAWCEQGPTHHCALGIGHVRASLRKVSELVGIPLIEVT
ncbi:MAG: hypothetical protein JNL62_30680, partial [Bryobacterales bacterium]|nr:hypothetical protein [Bryobacterales bacterium]